MPEKYSFRTLIYPYWIHDRYHQLTEMNKLRGVANDPTENIQNE
jgi:hypothetical protein